MTVPTSWSRTGQTADGSFFELEGTPPRPLHQGTAGETSMTMNRDFVETIRTIGPSFAARAAACDLEGRFVAESYAALKQEKLFSAGVPSELSGGGATFAELC